MRIVLMRHFKVQHLWKARYTSRGFDADQELYDTRPICETRTIDHEIEKVYVSELPRSRATSECLAGNKRIVATPLINELRVKSFIDTDCSLPTAVWDRVGLLQWRLNLPKQPETRRQTLERANRFVHLVEAEGEDCLVVSHCLFLRELSGVLLKRGYGGPEMRALLRNGEMVEYRTAQVP